VTDLPSRPGSFAEFFDLVAAIIARLAGEPCCSPKGRGLPTSVG
jgi:hypothetical protein